ncbi:MAG: phosphatidylserine decarboxylase [Nanoarchaeota archaeon]|nr:phosphatidylserine decarboxylase [Nanoarchaeota archaeon]
MAIETRTSAVGKFADRVGINKVFHRQSAVSAVAGEDCLVSPVQAKIAHIGRITDGSLISKAGRKVELSRLLGAESKRFQDCSYLNFYLRPTDKHFWITPYEGAFVYTQKNEGKGRPTIIALENVYSHIPVMRRIPVFEKAAKRNANIASVLDAGDFPIGMIAVGSLNVNRIVATYELGVPYPRGQICGHFKIGSTMLLLFPREFSPVVKEGEKVRLGQPVARREAHT